MATAVAMQSSSPHQTKMKRPSVPNVTTSTPSGTQSSPAPLMTSKRPPSAAQTPASPLINGNTSTSAGVQTRPKERKKDSLKPGDLARLKAKDGDRKPVKLQPEPYVKTSSHILKKYNGNPPSLVIHLHPKNFRFDSQNGSFSYSSPMKIILEHLKRQTVPHDMIEELVNAGVKFYEGCLIVQVNDHRSNKSATATSAESNSKLTSSIHNYEQWVTPSPYVPYPENKRTDHAPSPEPDALSSAKHDKSKEPKTYTIVLFPTPRSIQEEVFLQANTPEAKSSNRKSQAAPKNASSAVGVPPTPLNGAPPHPGSSQAKRQKMSINGAEIEMFESKITIGTAPPLFLDSVEDLEQSQELLAALADPLHQEGLPSPRTRKRTVAELAADERIAAQEQAFMLAMDEKHSNTLASGQTGANNESGTTAFEPRFEIFNAIQQIKAQHEEQVRAYQLQKQKHEIEMKRQDQRERAARAKLEHERAAREHKAAQLAQQAENLRVRQQHQERANQFRQQQALAAQQNAAAALAAQNGGANMPNGVHASQQGSPVMRHGSPQNHASPVVGAAGLPMQNTSSGQGSSPPGRPRSALQPNQPQGGVAMVHQKSRQTNPSRTGTPQMNGTPKPPNATPNMPQATPTMAQATPTSASRMQASPQMMQNAAAGQNAGGMNFPGNVGGMTQEQYQQMLAHSQRQQAFQNRVQHNQSMQQPQRQLSQQANGHMSPGGNQMQQLAAQQFRQQQEALMRQNMQNQQNAAAMNRMQSQQGLAANAGSPQRPGSTRPQQGQGPPPQQQQQQAQQQQQQVGGQARPMQQGGQMTTVLQQRYQQAYKESGQRLQMEMMNQLGLSNPNMLSQAQRQEVQRRAQQNAQEYITKLTSELQNRTLQQRQQAQIQQQAQQIQMLNAVRARQQQQQQQGNNAAGMMGMNGQMNLGGVGGGQGMTREQILAQLAQMNAMNGMGGMQ